MTAPIFILAGEASGDVLASRMMRAVHQHYGQQQWIGLGGPHMAAEGLRSVGDISRLSLIGVGAAIQHYRQLSAFADELVDLVLQQRPKLILTVDAKGFSVRFAARLRRQMQRHGWSAPIIHTVAPTVWAWGKWRRHKFARAFDGLLCLFPFEQDYFTPLGLESHFIGHPAAFDIQAEKPKSPSGSRSSGTASFGTASFAPRIALLPGSRNSEISQILPVMVAAVGKLRQHFPNAIVTLPAVPKYHHMISALCAEQPIEIVDGDQHLAEVLAHCDAVIAASGTVTLEAALFGAPGVACYKASWLSATLGRMIVDMQKVILPNAILGREVYPFLFQENLTATHLAEAVSRTLNDPQAKMKAYHTAKELRSSLVREADGFDQLVAAALDNWLLPGTSA
ncbi:lipid-A-disaccharide synthase [Alphaproteobacteria bacterium]|nr:lipid-A-disaccharide synthase [Alphaproteobacteria bacterium]